MGLRHWFEALGCVSETGSKENGLERIFLSFPGSFLLLPSLSTVCPLLSLFFLFHFGSQSKIQPHPVCVCV